MFIQSDVGATSCVRYIWEEKRFPLHGQRPSRCCKNYDNLVVMVTATHGVTCVICMKSFMLFPLLSETNFNACREWKKWISYFDKILFCRKTILLKLYHSCLVSQLALLILGIVVISKWEWSPSIGYSANTVHHVNISLITRQIFGTLMSNKCYKDFQCVRLDVSVQPRLLWWHFFAWLDCLWPGFKGSDVKFNYPTIYKLYSPFPFTEVSYAMIS